MDGLSVAANGLAVVSIAIQLTESCVKLHRFWEAVEDAPREVFAIKEDLLYLKSIFKRIECNHESLGECVAEGIGLCRIKVLELNSIVAKLEVGFQASSRRKRKWTAIKAAGQSKHVQRFRESLSETKLTLTLAMAYQCVVQSRSSPSIASNSTTHCIDNETYRSISIKATAGVFSQPTIANDAIAKNSCIAPLIYKENFPSLDVLSSIDKGSSASLTVFEQPLSPQAMTGLNLGELMLHAIRQTAVTAFEPSSLEIFAQDGYTIDCSGAVRSRTFVYSEHLRYQVCHHASSFQTAFGCLWVRTTTIKTPDIIGEEQKRAQSVTSFIFYPKRWLQLLGVRSGLEAIMASAGRSWVFNCRLTVTRAVPEDALIFELCKTGQTRAVETLLSRGLGSVVDTSPRGWKPLHFAAAGGHVDLCAMLIEAGADKTALVYEGPTTSILSPISLFVACASDLDAETKIAMLRLFSDCIDLSESDSDGWTVHEWLKKRFVKERVPISNNSITWLLSMTANEEYVTISATRIWYALQHALRTVLCHEYHNSFLEKALHLQKTERASISQSHLDAISRLIALKVSGRVLLPMVVSAGSFLRIKGFDWITDDLTYREYLQALPTLYSAWCQALLDCVERLEHYIQLEFEGYRNQQCWTRNEFVSAISERNVKAQGSYRLRSYRACTRCDNDYSSVPGGLVSPTQIAVSECTQGKYDFNYECQTTCDSAIPPEYAELPKYSGMCHDGKGEEEFDDIFFDAESEQLDDIASLGTDSCSIFYNIATVLYRSQGRVWMGTYTSKDHLCASCLLIEENFTCDDGLIADFSPVPESFVGLRYKW